MTWNRRRWMVLVMAAVVPVLAGSVSNGGSAGCTPGCASVQYTAQSTAYCAGNDPALPGAGRDTYDCSQPFDQRGWDDSDKVALQNLNPSCEYGGNNLNGGTPLSPFVVVDLHVDLQSFVDGLTIVEQIPSLRRRTNPAALDPLVAATYPLGPNSVSTAQIDGVITNAKNVWDSVPQAGLTVQVIPYTPPGPIPDAFDRKKTISAYDGMRPMAATSWASLIAQGYYVDPSQPDNTKADIDIVVYSEIYTRTGIGSGLSRIENLWSLSGNDMASPPPSTPGVNRPADLQFVLAHEIGHLLGIGHSTQGGALMRATHPSGFNLDESSSIKPVTLDALTYIYPLSYMNPAVILPPYQACPTPTANNIATL